MKGEHRQNLLKLFRKAGTRVSLWQVFSDFLQMAALAIANSDRYHVVNSKETWEAREKRYLEIIGKYPKDEEALFPEMLAELTMELDDHVQAGQFVDVLGETFHELELHNKWKGQFFSPQHICDLMGKIVMEKEDTRKAIDLYGYVAINEPCCGAGAMLFGFLNAFHEAGFNHSREVLVVANDVDERCVWMTYIQASLYGVPAVVIHQNSLSLEQYDAPWFSPVYTLDGWHFRERRAKEIRIEEQELMEMLA